MNKFSISATVAVFLFLLLLSGCAVNPEARLHLTGMATFIDDDPARDVDEDLGGYQVGVGKSFGENYKAEVALVGSHLNAKGFDADQEQIGIGVDILRKIGSSDYFYPYAVLGLGHLRTQRLAPGGRDYSGPMVSLGAGVITPFHVMGQAVRVEMRLRNDSGDTVGERYQDKLLSIGLHFPLGQPAEQRVDSDSDGVDDRRDKCEATPLGARVDSYGCARDLDSDQDGVPDAVDMCGGSKAGSKVDDYGCDRGTDSDGDGVVDDLDRCSDTAKGSRVDSRGCADSSTSGGRPPSPAAEKAPATAVNAALNDDYGHRVSAGASKSPAPAQLAMTSRQHFVLAEPGDPELRLSLSYALQTRADSTDEYAYLESSTGH